MAFPDHHRGVWDAATETFTSAARPLGSDELPILRAELGSDPAGRGYAGRTAAEQADLVNGTYLVPNPVPQGSVPAPLDPLALIGLLSPESQSKFEGWPFAASVLADIRAQSRPETEGWIAFAHERGIITDAEATALNGTLAATIPDPMWPAQVTAPSRGSVLFTGPPLTLEPSDIEQAVA